MKLINVEICGKTRVISDDDPTTKVSTFGSFILIYINLREDVTHR